MITVFIQIIWSRYSTLMVNTVQIIYIYFVECNLFRFKIDRLEQKMKKNYAEKKW